MACNGCWIVRAGMPSKVEIDPQNDPELELVKIRWAALPEAIRARIVGLVEGAEMRILEDVGRVLWVR